MNIILHMQVEPVGFGAVAEEASQAEVSRLFSAMLQLINNGNIQILPGQDQQPFQLRLMKTDLLHRQFMDGPAVAAHPSKVLDDTLMLPVLANLCVPEFDARRA